jgi:uncharacterized membrane protein
VTDEQKDAIARLERRLATLEEEVRRLSEARAVPAAVHRVVPTAPLRRPVSATLPTIVPTEPASAVTESRTDLEQWFGQRGLLAVGVAALIIAAAFFLKYAFDHGWIPPVVRSLMAIVAGIGIAAWGHERIGRGMRRYGAALIGAGGGLVFLGEWAAAGPYALIDRRVGILLLAATTVVVTLFALHHAIEGLALWALVGAYLAPILLPPPAPNPQAFLGYLEVIGLGTGILAYTMSWRRTFNLALFGYLMLASAGAMAALKSPEGCWLLAAGAILTIHVTRHRSWPEARLGVVLVAWLILAASLGQLSVADGGRWLALGAAMAVAGLLWWHHCQRDPFQGAGEPVDQILLILSPVVLIGLAWAATIPVLRSSPEIVPAVLGVIYAATGWQRRTASFLILGFWLVGLGMAFAWQPASITVGWTLLALGALAAERQGARKGGRHAAAGLAAAAFVCLFTTAVTARVTAAPVFADSWALALYAYVAGTAVIARWWGHDTSPAPWNGGWADGIWTLCGAAVFFGGSIQFARAFGRVDLLAGNLALSVWWLLYAGALVWLGFDLNRKMIRSAGLAVAAGAGLKIVLYDLSQLHALYRVGSFFALAISALTVAYAYNAKAKRAA